MKQPILVCHVVELIMSWPVPVCGDAGLVAGLVGVHLGLVLDDEPVLQVEGSDGRSSGQGFAEVRVDRRSGVRLPVKKVTILG